MQIAFTLPQEGGPSRLDRAVAQMTGGSRREARILIGAGRVFLGGKLCRIQTKPLRPGAKITVIDAQQAVAHRPTEQRTEPQPPRHQGRLNAALTLRIVAMDRWYVAVDKPAGLLSEPDKFGGPSVPSVLAAQLAKMGEHTRLWLVHRLDATTSGILLLARTPGCAAALNAAFGQRQIKKTYLAWVTGRLQGDTTVDAPILRVAGTRHGVGAQGRDAQTQVIVRGRCAHASLVELQPRTGRTHQIRVHMAHLGHPLLGDRLYNGPCYVPDSKSGLSQRTPVGRAMLHAVSLELKHPKTGEPLLLTAEMADDFAAFMDIFALDPALLTTHTSRNRRAYGQKTHPLPPSPTHCQDR